MKCFTYHSFIYKFRDSLQSLGLSPGLYAGHSFQRGSATHAFQPGVPVELIKMLRDWKSDSVQLYLTVPLQVRLMTANLVSKSVLFITSPLYTHITKGLGLFFIVDESSHICTSFLYLICKFSKMYLIYCVE